MVHEIKEFEPKNGPKDENGNVQKGPNVRAYKVEEPHEVVTLSGVQRVDSGYVVERDRPGVFDVLDGDTFEGNYGATNDQAVTDPREPAVPVSTESSQESDFDPSQHTISEVQSYIREHPNQRDEVLARERAGASRPEVLSA